jgi:hypothetical protein
VTGPGRRIVLKTVRKDVSRFIGVRPGLGTRPHADQSIHPSGGSFSGHLNPRCRDWVQPISLKGAALGERPQPQYTNSLSSMSVSESSLLWRRDTSHDKRIRKGGSWVHGPSRSCHWNSTDANRSRVHPPGSSCSENRCPLVSASHRRVSHSTSNCIPPDRPRSPGWCAAGPTALSPNDEK